MLINVVTMHVVQVPIMEVIDMILMPHSRVTATSAVRVGVVFVGGMVVHGSFLLIDVKPISARGPVSLARPCLCHLAPRAAASLQSQDEVERMPAVAPRARGSS